MNDLYKAAYDKWQEKTEWVQQTATYDELGMHRADVLKKRIDELEAENEDLKHQINSLEIRYCNLESDIEDAYRQCVHQSIDLAIEQSRNTMKGN